ncbi:hypothetical protein MGYG_04099 [Nannizzia gypsea CBS 118893]|uniref:Uncharacterized protein n=1 Tax=Arthroderma gypseum (strain ATCC MYA-4604 / CBS 118893) TaxID=535722 RepID=E4UUX8_ARTGP|nr:hypothetical protein MGYG_04099 [Nannizzia gypsea CBS 118893]EFR01095.1 hypothetical protein MGYG_04099 [Nannizzia gypsea CBS 118893]
MAKYDARKHLEEPLLRREPVWIDECTISRMEIARRDKHQVADDGEKLRKRWMELQIRQSTLHYRDARSPISVRTRREKGEKERDTVDEPGGSGSKTRAISNTSSARSSLAVKLIKMDKGVTRKWIKRRKGRNGQRSKGNYPARDILS